MKTCKIIRDKITGNSFGFGFAEYYDPLHAKQAVELLNGTEIRDKRIKVNSSNENIHYMYYRSHQ